MASEKEKADPKRREARPVMELTGDAVMDQMLKDCIKTLQLKGAEYTIGSEDRLANFRRVAEQVDSTPEKTWFTYFYKHYCALVSYIKKGKVTSNEPIEGRIMDMIVYLLLFTKMVKENQAPKFPTPGTYSISCGTCHATFFAKEELQRHVGEVHGGC